MTYHHGSLRETLLAEARARLRVAAVADLSIRELARAAGVSPNAPYRHFADRDAIIRALVGIGYAEAAEALERRAGRGSRAVGEVWSALAGTDPELVDAMTAIGVASHPDVAPAVERWFRAVVAAVETDMRGASADRVLSRAALCWGAVHGVGALRRAGAFDGVEDLLPAPKRIAVHQVRD